MKIGPLMEDRTSPVEELEDVMISEGKTFTVEKELSGALKEELSQCLKRNLDVFAWSAEDMSGIDPSLVVYKLNVQFDKKPIKQ